MFCVTYDLPEDSDRGPLVDRIKEFASWWHHLESTWLVATEDGMSATDVARECRRVAPPGGKVLVFEVGEAWAGFGFNERGTGWLQRNWPSLQRR